MLCKVSLEPFEPFDSSRQRRALQSLAKAGPAVQVAANAELLGIDDSPLHLVPPRPARRPVGVRVAPR